MTLQFINLFNNTYYAQSIDAFLLEVLFNSTCPNNDAFTEIDHSKIY